MEKKLEIRNIEIEDYLKEQLGDREAKVKHLETKITQAEKDIQMAHSTISFMENEHEEQLRKLKRTVFFNFKNNIFVINCDSKK